MATLLKLKTTTTALAVSVILSFGGSGLHAQYVQSAPQRDHINVAQQFNQSGFQTGGQFNDGGRAYPGGMHIQGQSFNPGAFQGGAIQPFNPTSTGNNFQGYPGSMYGAAGSGGYGMQPMHSYGSGPGPGSVPQAQGIQSFPGHSYGGASQFSPMQAGMQNAQPWEMHRHWSDFHVPQSAGQLYQMNSNEIRSQPTFGRR